MDTTTARAVLNDELRRLRSHHAKVEAHLMNRDHAVPQDFEEQATFRENDEVLEVLDEAARRRLVQVTEAIARLDAGTWGTCANCGQEIEPRRLTTLPWTPFCATCAAEREG